jgi:hypothetical protein
MKKVFNAMMCATLLGLVACGPDKESEKQIKELRTYVDSVERENTSYYNDETYWMNVENEYKARQEKIDAKADKLSAESKKEYNELKAEYAALKAKYEAERAKVKEARSYKMMLRSSLFGEGKIGDDMNFAFMDATNAVSVYEAFVNTVDNNKEAYSREDWDEIKVLYEAMDTRKNQIEKDLAKKDNNRIAGLKIKFAAIKALNRPVSKMEENSDAKN